MPRLPEKNTDKGDQEMNYEEFRDKVKGVLLKNKNGLTWSQIKEKLNLPQKVPNNKWVKWLEKDIKLVREKKGTIIWRI